MYRDAAVFRAREGATRFTSQTALGDDLPSTCTAIIIGRGASDRVSGDDPQYAVGRKKR